MFTPASLCWGAKSHLCAVVCDQATCAKRLAHAKRLQCLGHTQVYQSWAPIQNFLKRVHNFCLCLSAGYPVPVSVRGIWSATHLAQFLIGTVKIISLVLFLRLEEMSLIKYFKGFGYQSNITPIQGMNCRIVYYLVCLCVCTSTSPVACWYFLPPYKQRSSAYALWHRPPGIGTPHLIKYVVTMCGCCVLSPPFD